jgi:hypothetical protein
MGEYIQKPGSVQQKQPGSGRALPGAVPMTAGSGPFWSAPPALRLTTAGRSVQRAVQPGLAPLRRPGMPVIQRLKAGDPLPNLDTLVAKRYDAESRPVDITEEIPAATRLVTNDKGWETFATSIGSALTAERLQELRTFFTTELPGANVNAGLAGLKPALSAGKRFTVAQRAILDRLEASTADTLVGQEIETGWASLTRGVVGDVSDVHSWLLERGDIWSLGSKVDWNQMKVEFLGEPAIPEFVLDDFRSFVRKNWAQKVRTDKLNALKMDKVTLSAPPSAESTSFDERERKRQMSATLESLEPVKALLNRPLAQPLQAADWKGGGAPAVTLEPAVSGKTEDALAPLVVKQKAADADAKIRQMVDPAVLANVPPPPVFAFPHKATDYRAFCDSTGVHVAHHDRVDIFVHEMGHWIEDRLPVEKWFNIQAMLYKRHALAKGGKKSVGGLGSSGDAGMGRFAGIYGTGNYTSKIYEESGATEVVSKTLEELATRESAIRLIWADPVLVATVLMQVNPGAFDVNARKVFQPYVHNA